MALEQMFIDMINTDIKETQQVLESGGANIDLLNKLHGKYSKISSNYPEIIINHVKYRANPPGIKQDVIAILGFLEAFKSNNYCDIIIGNSDPSVVIHNSNVADIKVSLKAQFDNTIQKVEDMEALSDGETNEIISKIEELNEIIMSDEKRKAKWLKSKKILLWLLDKGVDVVIAVIPLIMKI